jgi:hopene-associated glycosyltransferase HpnB
VVAVIPARDEAEVIGETLRSLWSQEYPGTFRIVLVDDHSDDGTAEIALGAARAVGREAELQVLSAEPLPAGWTGKVWAMHQGVTRGLPATDPARYVLFSDADISHGPDALAELVSRAEAGGCDLVSFMVRLQCASRAERLMIPAFVFFFKLLYPFRKINNEEDPLAGAAGGTMLLRRSALERIGGMECIRAEVIDDCTLAAAVKRGGHRIWLGQSSTSVSTRGYGTLREIVRMIARTAYTQLGYSPLRLAGCVFGFTLTFLGPPLLALSLQGPGALLGAAAWVLMSLLYLPMVRFYRLSPLWAPLLPVTASVYLWATILSGWWHHRGKGGWWKGRSQAPPRTSTD